MIQFNSITEYFSHQNRHDKIYSLEKGNSRRSRKWLSCLGWMKLHLGREGGSLQSPGCWRWAISLAMLPGHTRFEIKAVATDWLLWDGAKWWRSAPQDFSRGCAQSPSHAPLWSVPIASPSSYDCIKRDKKMLETKWLLIEWTLKFLERHPHQICNLCRPDGIPQSWSWLPREEKSVTPHVIIPPWSTGGQRSGMHWWSRQKRIPLSWAVLARCATAAVPIWKMLSIMWHVVTHFWTGWMCLVGCCRKSKHLAEVRALEICNCHW